jgi:hypothetical protein
VAIPPTILFPKHSVAAIWNYAAWGSDPMSVFLDLSTRTLELPCRDRQAAPFQGTKVFNVQHRRLTCSFLRVTDTIGISVTGSHYINVFRSPGQCLCVHLLTSAAPNDVSTSDGTSSMSKTPIAKNRMKPITHGAGWGIVARFTYSSGPSVMRDIWVSHVNDAT